MEAGEHVGLLAIRRKRGHGLAVFRDDDRATGLGHLVHDARHLALNCDAWIVSIRVAPPHRASGPKWVMVTTVVALGRAVKRKLLIVFQVG